MVCFRTVLLVSAAAISLAACREDARPQAGLGYAATSPEYVDDLPLAPAGEALTVGRPAPVGRLTSYRDDGYAWAERAYAVDRAFYESPPDYGFYYDDVEPWVWETEDHWFMYAEPLASGYRYYYYEPGEDYPYFVRDPDYGYGFDDGGRLVTVYTVAGALLSPRYLEVRAPIAGRYWTRAIELRRIGARAERREIDPRQWRSREPVLIRSQARWLEAAEDRRDWRSYRDRQGAREIHRFDRERDRRETVIAKLDRQAPLRAEQDKGWLQRGRGDDHREHLQNRLDFSRPDDHRDRSGERGRPMAERQAFAPQDIRRQERAGRDDRDGRRQEARLEPERRNIPAFQERGRQARQEQAAREQERGRRQEHEARQQQARAEAGRHGAQAVQERGRQARQEQAAREQERRGRQEHEARQQQVRAEAERRNAQVIEERGRQARQEQAAREQERRGRQEHQARQQQAANEVRAAPQEHRRQARNAGQAAQEANAQEPRGHGRGGGKQD